MYHLSLLAVCLFAGGRPYARMTPEQVQRAVMNEPLALPSTVPSDLREAFGQALAREPQERPSLAELRGAVDAANPANTVACIEWLDRMFQGLSLMSAVGRHAASAADAQAVRTLVAERRYLAGRPLIGSLRDEMGIEALHPLPRGARPPDALDAALNGATPRSERPPAIVGAVAPPPDRAPVVADEEFSGLLAPLPLSYERPPERAPTPEHAPTPERAPVADEAARADAPGRAEVSVVVARAPASTVSHAVVVPPAAPLADRISDFSLPAAAPVAAAGPPAPGPATPVGVSLILGLFGCVPEWGDDTGGGDDTGTDTVPVDDLHVSFVYVGPVGDHGWTKTHDDGRLYLEEALGVTTSYEPSVSPADTVDVVQEFVDVGADVVFTTSFDFVSQTQQDAAIHPDVSFLSCSGGVWSTNLGSYMGRMYQAMYLAGMVAGQMTTTNRVGLVLSVPIPEIVRHTNAFALGAREVNPDVVVEVQWVNNWFDAEVEPEVTNLLIAHGADVVMNQTDTTIPLETANGQTATYDDGSGNLVETPVYTIGYDNPDSCSPAEESCLTSAYWNWGPMYASIVQQIADGTWNPQEIIWEQMRATPSESSVNLSDFSTIVPGAVRLAVDAKIPELVDESGSQLPFRGPIKDSTGSTRVSSGVERDDEALNRMCWFVEGVVTRDGDTDEPAEVPAGCGGDY